MLEKIKKLWNAVEHRMFGVVSEPNIYSIPCQWVISGSVQVEADNIEAAKAYVRMHKVAPVLENCICCNFKADTEQPMLCECGCCGREYIVSSLHNPSVCPYCGNGGETDEL